MGSNVTVMGSQTCEDTAITLDRLRALHVKAEVRYKETDAAVPALLERYIDGEARTPIVVFGEDATVLIEPDMDALETALQEAGYALQPPHGVEYHGEEADRPAPDFDLPNASGGRTALYNLRGRRRTALAFMHDPACRVCQGYARQLAARASEFAEYEGRAVIILPTEPDLAAHWAREFAPGVEVLCDPDGTARRRFLTALGASLDPQEGDVLEFVLDRFAAPRAGQAARDAGGLMSAGEIAKWFNLLDCECSE